MELRELLLGGPGHDGYAYNGDTYCCDCGRGIIKDLAACGAFAGTSDDELRDTGTCPQPIYFGESDCAEHCADCGEYLYGPQNEPDDDESGDESDD